MSNKYFHLKNADPLDINDVLLKVQRSFGIKFNSADLGNVATFGDLCDVIQSKISLEHEDSCTTQHAFYMLRKAVADMTGIDKCSLTPHSRLAKLFPRENRFEAIAALEEELGFSVKLLQPKQWVISVFALIFIASFIYLFFNWPIGLAGCLASVLGFKMAGKFGKEIHLKTVGDLANKISRESYLKARRNSNVNRNEIEQKVRELFANELELEPVMITRKSPF